MNYSENIINTQISVDDSTQDHPLDQNFTVRLDTQTGFSANYTIIDEELWDEVTTHVSSRAKKKKRHSDPVDKDEEVVEISYAELDQILDAGA